MCSICEHCEGCCECERCSSCSTRATADDICEDCECCRSCCRCSLRVIRDYGTNPLRYLKFIGCPQKGLYLGAELEVEARNGRDVGLEAKKWHDVADGFFILKSDGSLTNGFEIVTAPASLAFQRHRWSELLENRSLTAGIASETRDSCGLHVHVSTDPLVGLSLGKILKFMNDPANRSRLNSIAGRSGSSYARFEDHAFRKGLHLGFMVDQHSHRLPRRLRTERLQRYVVVNVTGKRTAEFRLYKGTLTKTKLIGRLEFTDAVCQWAHETSLRDLCWQSLGEWVAKRSNQYRYALELMQAAS